MGTPSHDLRNEPHRVMVSVIEISQQLSPWCCTTCHNFYPHYEMKLIMLPGGSPAWICDNVRWAIYPEEYRKLQEWSRNSPEGKLLREIFGDDVDE
jgi:hypothetical protein